MGLTAAAPTLGSHNVRATAEWFRDVLSFTLDPETGVFEGVGDEEKGGVYAIVRRDQVTFHIQIRRRPVFAGERGEFEGDAYVYVDDVDALYEEYLAAGVPLHRAIQDEAYGMRDFTIATPDGHRIAFGSPT